MATFTNHSAPVWGPMANFMILADLSEHGMPGQFEQFWARTGEGSDFMICCVPFFTYGIALGDQVRCDSQHTIESVVSKGGHRTLRVAVADRNNEQMDHNAIHAWVAKTGLLYEFQSPGYLAVDLPPTFEMTVEFGLSELAEAIDIATEVDG